MKKHRRLFILASSLTIAVLMVGFTVGTAFGAPPQNPPWPAANVTYYLYATDGYWKMADGTYLYSYGFVGGRANEPWTYLSTRDPKAYGAATTLPASVATPHPVPVAGAVGNAYDTALRGNAQFPAPLIWARTNDIVEIRLKNLGVSDKNAPNDPHSIHLHAVDVDAANDGVPETSVAAVPSNSAFTGAGNIVVYMFTTDKPGTYMYHCHQEADIHVTMGMYGALVIYDLPAAGRPNSPGKAGTLWGWDYDREYIMMLSDTDTRIHAAENMRGPGFNMALFSPQYWFVNGLSFPNSIHAGFLAAPAGYTWANWIAAHPGMDPFIMGEPGEKVLVRMVSLAFETDPMHMHGFHAKVLGSDQRPWTWGFNATTGMGLEKNTINIGSGETYELLFDMSQQNLTSTYPNGTASPGGPRDTQSKHIAGVPTSNTNTAGVAIPDPLVPGANYIGGPQVKGLAVPPALAVGAGPDLLAALGTSQFFPFHNHDDYKATNNGVYPGGMFTMIVIVPTGILPNPH